MQKWQKMAQRERSAFEVKCVSVWLYKHPRTPIGLNSIKLFDIRGERGGWGSGVRVFIITKKKKRMIKTLLLRAESGKSVCVCERQC